MRSTASPATPTRSSTTSAATLTWPQHRAAELGRRSSSATSARRERRPRVPRRRRHRAAVGHPASSTSRRSSRRWRWTSPSPTTRPTTTLRPTSTAPPPSSGCRWCRSSSRWHPGPTTRPGPRRGLPAGQLHPRRRRGPRPRPRLPAVGGPRAVRPHARRPRAARRRRPGPGAAAFPGRAGPAPRVRRPAGDRAARPDEPTLHRGRARPLLRHRRRGRSHRLRGVRPAVRPCRSPAGWPSPDAPGVRP